MRCLTASRYAMAIFPFLAMAATGGCQLTNTLDNFSQSLNEINDGMSAYATKATNDGPDMASADLPEFGVGDAFVFDSGRAVYVTETSGKNVMWNGGGDYNFVTTADFTLPNLEWSYTDKEGQKRSGTTSIRDGSKSIWPLAFDKQVRIYITSENIDPETDKTDQYQQWLSCSVPATETVTVEAGTFDTYVIECARHLQQWWMQTTKWWYAPKIGYYVKRERKWKSGEYHREDLMTFGPAPAKIPSTDRKRLAALVQTTLEDRLSGKTVTSKGAITIAITPLNTVQTDKGVWCRTYRQSLSARNRTSSQIKSACRTEKGWVVEDDIARYSGSDELSEPVK